VRIKTKYKFRVAGYEFQVKKNTGSTGFGKSSQFCFHSG